MLSTCVFSTDTDGRPHCPPRDNPPTVTYAGDDVIQYSGISRSHAMSVDFVGCVDNPKDIYCGTIGNLAEF